MDERLTKSQPLPPRPEEPPEVLAVTTACAVCKGIMPRSDIVCGRCKTTACCDRCLGEHYRIRHLRDDIVQWIVVAVVLGGPMLVVVAWLLQNLRR